MKLFRSFKNSAKLSGDTPLATASIGNWKRVCSIRRPGWSNSRSQRAHDVLQRQTCSCICFALVHGGLGDKDQAIAWLEKAYKERSDFLLVLRVDPLFDPLRSDPRFQETEGGAVSSGGCFLRRR